MELTKEYFDNSLANLLVKIEELIEKRLDQRFLEFEQRFEAKIDTKLDQRFADFEIRILAKVEIMLEAQTEKITEAYQHFTIQAFETHQIWVEEHFKEWIQPYDVRARVSRLETTVTGLKNLL